MEKRSCTVRARAAEREATTTAAGSPRATSSAWLGPESTARLLRPSAPARISVGRARVFTSMPLVTEQTGTPRGSDGASPVQAARRCWVGTAETASEAPAKASAASPVTRSPRGSVTPGR